MKEQNNKSYKLFGIINLVDFLVILLILAGCVFGVYKLSQKAEESGHDTIVLHFHADEVSDFVAEKLEDGCRLYDDSHSVELGFCEHPVVDEAITYGMTSEGEYVLSSREGYSSVDIDAVVEGKRLSNGAKIDGTQYNVGDYIVLRAGDAKIYLALFDIE